jgi:hypothetical protein
MERFQNQNTTTNKLTRAPRGIRQTSIHLDQKTTKSHVLITRSILKRNNQAFGVNTMSVRRVRIDALIGGHNLTFGSYVSYAKTVFWILKMVVKGLA